MASLKCVEKDHLLVRLRPDGVALCGESSQACRQVQDTVTRRVRDSDLLDRRLSVEFTVRRAYVRIAEFAAKRLLGCMAPAR